MSAAVALLMGVFFLPPGPHSCMNLSFPIYKVACFIQIIVEIIVDPAPSVLLFYMQFLLFIHLAFPQGPAYL